MENMHYDGASTFGGGKMSMHLFPTTPSPSLSSSSRIVDFTDPPSYSSIFFSPSNASHSHSATRTNTATAAISTSAAASAPAGGDRYDHSLLMLEHQDLLSRHKSCLTQLQKTFQEAETLRQENTNLRVANCDLNSRLKRLVEAYLQNQYTSVMMTPGSSSLSPEYVNAPLSSITEKLSGMRLGEKIRESAARWEGCESPKSVIESDRAERDVDRGSLPKSISVRSSGFLKAAGQVTSTTNITNTSRGANRSRPAVPVDGPQKVYVRGGNQKDGPIELEVFNQGMIKTELCNKWQETGSCPYGEHCQFAHGFEELRPVLRHPRYKTEVCRMVLAGDPCPYGHRCHFRHALTDQEKLMLPLKLD